MQASAKSCAKLRQCKCTFMTNFFRIAQIDLSVVTNNLKLVSLQFRSRGSYSQHFIFIVKYKSGNKLEYPA